MSALLSEQRLAKLLRLRDQVDSEIAAELDRLAASVPPKVNARRSRNVVPPCGTEEGYQHHRSVGEPMDELCRVGHRHHVRTRTAAREAS